MNKADKNAVQDILGLIQFVKMEEILSKIHLDDKEEIKQLQLNKDYPMHKDLFGVKIEVGAIRFLRTNQETVSFLFNELFVMELSGKKQLKCTPKNSVDSLQKIIDGFKLEPLNPLTVLGYQMNQEMVRFIRDDADRIVIKYKDSPENIFYVYRFYFTRVGQTDCLVIEKSI